MTSGMIVAHKEVDSSPMTYGKSHPLWMKGSSKIKIDTSQLDFIELFRGL
jgi:hypothetical protein